MKACLPGFKKEFQELSREVEEEGDWKNLKSVNSSKEDDGYGEEALDTSSKVSLGIFRYQSKVPPRILFTGTGGKKSKLTPADWQERLCRVFVNGKA